MLTETFPVHYVVKKGLHGKIPGITLKLTWPCPDLIVTSAVKTIELGIV